MTRTRRAPGPYPPIGDYALIGDCRAAALVSRTGSIDWCCMPRMDGGSVFARLLDWDRGGHCQVRPTDEEAASSRTYIDDTMVLETLFRTASGEARVIDCFVIRNDPEREAGCRLLRIIEGVRGTTSMVVEVPRFDYGDVEPWLRYHGPGSWSAVGGDNAVAVTAELDLDLVGGHALHGGVTVRAREQARLSITSHRPEELDDHLPDQLESPQLDRLLDATLRWWRKWSGSMSIGSPEVGAGKRSALVLKALTHAPTGAIAAAPTTSLPEVEGGDRNWDYRNSWIRDSQFTVRALSALGCTREADAFRRFIERSAAGSAESLRIVYGLGGERRLPEIGLDLEGYRGASPVRVGNAAFEQVQLDVYGELLDLAWQWHLRGQSPDDDYWRFLLSLVDAAADRWEEADHGIWEIRGAPRHYVHSKVMCWAALDRGIRLAGECMRLAPVKRWARMRDRVRRSVETSGVDDRRGCFVQAYGSNQLDAALLLVPTVDFVAYDDPRMVATVDAVIDVLSDGGLLRRHNAAQHRQEGVFVACTFWLVEVLSAQGRVTDARSFYDRAVSTANDLGLFAEQYDPATGDLRGNFPQGLTHLSHIAAANALARGHPSPAAPNR